MLSGGVVHVGTGIISSFSSSCRGLLTLEKGASLLGGLSATMAHRSGPLLDSAATDRAQWLRILVAQVAALYLNGRGNASRWWRSLTQGTWTACCHGPQNTAVTPAASPLLRLLWALPCMSFLEKLHLPGPSRAFFGYFLELSSQQAHHTKLSIRGGKGELRISLLLERQSKKCA
jgi:hypothetical protein